MREHDQECGNANSMLGGTSRLGQITVVLLNRIVSVQIPGSSLDDSKAIGSQFPISGGSAGAKTADLERCLSSEEQHATVGEIGAMHNSDSCDACSGHSPKDGGGYEQDLPWVLVMRQIRGSRRKQHAILGGQMVAWDAYIGAGTLTVSPSTEHDQID